MKGKKEFTSAEANAIIELIRRKVVSGRNEQKRLRDKIRALGFYASDFGIGGGYTEHDFLRVVKIQDKSVKSDEKTGDDKQLEQQKPTKNMNLLKKYSFPPISKPDAEILVLGTMPGEKSLALKQYYGHGGNQFWKVMFECLGAIYSDDYHSKKQLLTDNKIALWDVLQHCERTGSSDNNIKDEFPNDFEEFFNAHPRIKIVIFNGNNANEYFSKYVGFDAVKKYITLPSTSPANTWLTRKQKIEEWRSIFNNYRDK